MKSFVAYHLAEGNEDKAIELFKKIVIDDKTLFIVDCYDEV